MYHGFHSGLILILLCYHFLHRAAYRSNQDAMEFFVTVSAKGPFPLSYCDWTGNANKIKPNAVHSLAIAITHWERSFTIQLQATIVFFSQPRYYVQRNLCDLHDNPMLCFVHHEFCQLFFHAASAYFCIFFSAFHYPVQSSSSMYITPFAYVCMIPFQNKVFLSAYYYPIASLTA